MSKKDNKKELSNKEKILELLKDTQLTSSEISEETGIDIDSVYVYLNQLYNNEKVERTTDKKPYKYKNSTLKVMLNECKGLLKFMNNFFKDNLEHLIKNKDIVSFIQKNEEKFNKIEELV
jgi:sugar-specific transcriptional regulator TrmB